jgi:hypothetical protein
MNGRVENPLNSFQDTISIGGIKIMKNVLTGLALLILSTACSSSKDETAPDNQQHRALYNAVNQPLDKAKDVERQILDNAAEQKKQADNL